MNEINIVIAEDEPLLLRTLVRQVQYADSLFKVVYAAPDGESALQFLQNHQVPDILITDIHMPVLDGIGLIKAVERAYPAIKKIIISGYSEFEYAQQALKMNVIDYMLKPVKKQDLEDLLSRLKIKIVGERSAMKSMIPLSNRQYNAEEIVKSVEEFIKTNYAGEISLEEISKRFNVNAPHLSKIFLKYAGESPSRYIMTLRMNEAKHLLSLKNELTVKEIGEAVGYPDPFYFSRMFKQFTGITPTEYKSRLT
ncbi:response regulator [Cohnella sp. LGH]|uniref:response regulator transcription factor n=1 Tax=Cohnella sp. LGH TaxID=1619153 RepID=UPI001ADA477D|nr:response regulator [Cohnella sp. LGH]QTH41559.1 response regulator [Cohnella sp. LGH]